MTTDGTPGDGVALLKEDAHSRDSEAARTSKASCRIPGEHWSNGMSFHHASGGKAPHKRSETE